MTYVEALMIHHNPRIRSAGKLREAARAVFARGLTADYAVVVALYERAERREAYGVAGHDGAALECAP